MRVTMMIVPGKIVHLEVPDGASVLAAAGAAAQLHPENDWVNLTKSKEVRVNGRKFSNALEYQADAGYVGDITTTSLAEGNTVMILANIAGNDHALVCVINGQEYALETPDTIRNVLRDVAGIDPDKVNMVLVDDAPAHLEDLVGHRNVLEVRISRALIVVAGQEYAIDSASKLAAIHAITEL